MPVEVIMPKMSDHMETGKVIRWLVKEGAEVTERQPILEIETDKAIGEVEAPASGILSGIRAQEGAEVPVGEVIAFVAKPGEKVPELSPVSGPRKAVAMASVAAAAPAEAGPILAAPAARRVAKELGVDLAHVHGTGPGGRIKEEDVRAFAAQMQAAPAPSRVEAGPVAASPLARKLAKEHSVDLAQVQGTGPGGRVTHEDVLAYVEKRGAYPAEAGVAEPAGEGFEWVELSTIRRITGERMTLSKQTVPHFVLSVEVDMSQAARLRDWLMPRVEAETGERVSYTSLLVKVVALALKRHPLANAEFADGRIKVHRAINVGVAVGVEQGLVVPVVRSADSKSLADISKELKSYQQKAESLRFAPTDLAGGTFTISNLGMMGIDQFSAIINVPQSAILAVGRILNKPVGLADGSVGLRPMMAMTLSVDHRVLDGVTGARFLTEVKDMLENPYGLL